MNITQFDNDFIQLDIYHYKAINNVISYEYTNYNNWSICINNSTYDTIPQYYVMIDAFHHDAFGHWVYESAIYLPFFNLLKLKYPTIKLHLKSNKKFKLLFCKYFNIEEYDIVTSIISNNICIYTKPISALNYKSITEEYKSHVVAFINALHIPIQIKNIEHLLMPRGANENYIGNERVLNMDNIIQHINDMSDSTYTLYTDTISSLAEQMHIVSSASTIYITDGSACIVNGLFASNSTIIVLGNILTNQSNEYIKMKYICELIASKNKVIYIPYLHGSFQDSIFYYDDIKRLISYST